MHFNAVARYVKDVRRHVLSEKHLDELRRVCKNSLNYTDGGHWIGEGPEPVCFGREVSNLSEHKTTILFQSDSGAQAWNTAQEKAAMGSNLVLSLLSAGLASMAGLSSVPAFVLGGASTVLNNELTSSRSFPTVLKGWKVVIVVKYIVSESTLASSNFEMVTSLQVFDSSGAQKHNQKSVYSLPYSRNLEFLRKLAAMKNSSRSIVR